MMNMNSENKRIHPRYCVPHSDDPCYEYEVVMTKTKVHAKIDQQQSIDHDYLGFIKNVSVEGLCFSSDGLYEYGQIVEMEVELPGAVKSIHMEGEVQWNKLVEAQEKMKEEPDELAKFRTGIKVIEVDGKMVSETIHFEENYHIQWSIVLDSIFGNFRCITSK